MIRLVDRSQEYPRARVWHLGEHYYFTGEKALWLGRAWRDGAVVLYRYVANHDPYSGRVNTGEVWADLDGDVHDTGDQ